MSSTLHKIQRDHAGRTSRARTPLTLPGEIPHQQRSLRRSSATTIFLARSTRDMDAQSPHPYTFLSRAWSVRHVPCLLLRLLPVYGHRPLDGPFRSLSFFTAVCIISHITISVARPTERNHPRRNCCRHNTR